MALNISVEPVHPRSILDALNDAYNLNKNRIASKYAQQNAQANLNRLNALIQQANLGNQKLGLQMPYVAPKSAAEVKDLLAKSALTNLEAQYVPTKYAQESQRLGIEQRNLDLNKLIHSPEQLQALLQARQAKIQRDQALSNPEKIQTDLAYKKAILDNLQRQNAPLDENGIPIAQQDNIPVLTGDQKKVNSDEGQWVGLPAGKTRSGAYKAYQNNKTGVVRQVLTEPMRTQLLKQQSGFGSLLSVLDELKKQGQTGVLGFRTPNDEAMYKAALAEVVEPSVNAVQLPKVKAALARLDDIFARKKYTTQDEYLKQLGMAMNGLQSQLEVSNKSLRHNAIEIPPEKGSKQYDAYLKSKNKLGEALPPMPNFNNRQEFNEWKASLSPQQIEYYKTKLGH